MPGSLPGRWIGFFYNSEHIHQTPRTTSELKYGIVGNLKQQCNFSENNVYASCLKFRVHFLSITMVPDEKPESSKGLLRVWRAFFYSLSGLKLAARDQAAFRQEILLVAVLSIVCIFLPIERWVMVMLLFSHALVLIVELLNTAIEAVVDKTFPGFHEDAKKAKDCASAAVLLSLLSSGGIWCYALFTIWMN